MPMLPRLCNYYHEYRQYFLIPQHHPPSSAFQILYTGKDVNTFCTQRFSTMRWKGNDRSKGKECVLHTSNMRNQYLSEQSGQG
eukprot:3112397-Ditylum_brightwellii.AAC.1